MASATNRPPGPDSNAVACTRCAHRMRVCTDGVCFVPYASRPRPVRCVLMEETRSLGRLHTAVSPTLVGTLIALIAVFGACRSVRSRVSIRHPIDSLETFPPHPKELLVDSTVADFPASVRLVADRLFHVRPVGVVGSLTGPKEYVFGHVRATVLDSAFDLIAMDGDANEVRVFSPRGSYLYSIGARGVGAGKFQRPLSMALGGNGELFIGDMAHTVNVFVPDNGRYVFARRFRLRVQPLDMCILRGHLFVHSVTLGDDDVIFKYTTDGRFEEAFGSVYHSSTAFVNYTISRGEIACDRANQTVVYSPAAFIGVVEGYSPTGTRKWVRRLPDYVSYAVQEAPDGGVSTIPPQHFALLRSLTYIGSGFSLVQVASYTQSHDRGNRSYDQVTSYLVAGVDGVGGRVATTLAPVVAFRAPYFVAARDDPFEQFDIDRERRRLASTVNDRDPSHEFQ